MARGVPDTDGCLAWAVPLPRGALLDRLPCHGSPPCRRAQVQFVAGILDILWPKVRVAVVAEVRRQSAAPIAAALGQTGGLVTSLDIEHLDLGPLPPRLDSVRALLTTADELILETPLFWGSEVVARVVARVRVPGVGAVVEVPLEVRNVQFRALARIVVAPLVESLPCVGGVSVTLMEAPHIDAEVRVAGSPDLGALPFVPAAMMVAMRTVVGRMLVYPNSMSFPVMDAYGLPPPPLGMLRVTVVSGTNLKSSLFDTVDPFCVLEVRDGRPLRTRTVDDNPNPEWDETFDFVVDDPRTQSLRIAVRDEDVLASSIVGIAAVVLKDAGALRVCVVGGRVGVGVS